MIEFNTPAKAENPLLSLLDTELYLMFSVVKLAGQSAVDPKAKHKALIAKIKSSIPKGKVQEKLYQTGWVSGIPQDPMPLDIDVWIKGMDCLYLPTVAASWHKLDNWASLMKLLPTSAKKEHLHDADNTLFKICVMGYTVSSIDKDGHPILKPGWAGPDDLSHEEEEEEAQHEEPSPPMTSQESLSIDSLLSAFYNNSPVPSPVDSNGNPE